ncbi:MAG: hypothetical protein U0V56_04025 [Actinomycetota bacterium]
MTDPRRPALAVWWRGARPRTLGVGLVPVAVGASAAGHVTAWRLAAAVLVAMGLQVGVNYANDFFDGIRGVDSHERLGPPRLTQSGAASPRRCWSPRPSAWGPSRLSRGSRWHSRPRRSSILDRRRARVGGGVPVLRADPGRTRGSGWAS